MIVHKYFHRSTFVLTFFLVFHVGTPLSGQINQRLQAPVSWDGKMLKFPWAGGLNAPQFSEIDLDGDQKKDLFIFDRIGNVSLTFLNKGGVGESDYQFAPAYQKSFPTMKNFVLLRDYNGDGLEDVFCYSLEPGVSGFSVFTTQKVGDDYSFLPFQFNFSPNVMPFDPGNGIHTNLYVAPTDYPALADVDADGDLDVLTFDLGGTVVYYYSNQSIEMGYGQDSLIFVLADDCWGRFKESGISAEVKLSDNPDECAEGLKTGGGIRHSGSTILAADISGNASLDLVLGDLFNQHLTLLNNAGTSVDAWMNSQDIAFPSYDLPVDMAVFNAAFYLDLNNDGKKDLVAAPNSINLIQDIEGTWLYENNSPDDTPDFSFEKNNFLTEDMIDVGTGANPAFADVNGDGLQDLVLGNFSYYKAGGAKDSRLALFINQGSASNPSFILENDNWLDFSLLSGSSYDFAPTFGDLDNDGDLDLLVGEQQGGLFFLENIAGPGNPMSFSQPQYPYQNIDKGQSTTPQIIDLNRDGLPDIVLGERNGFLTYFQNIGTPENPVFEPDASMAPNINKLGGVDTRGVDPTQGYSAPCFVDFEGVYMLFCGSVEGGIFRYSNIDGNLDGNFTLETKGFGDIRDGARTHPAIADINDNGLLDLIVGNFRGGVSLYETLYQVDGSVNLASVETHPMEMVVFPNPAGVSFQVHMKSGEIFPGDRWDLIDPLGKVLKSGTVQDTPLKIDVKEVPVGHYYFRVITGSGIATTQVFVQ